MLHPNQFQVNEAWIVFKLNDAAILTKKDGAFHVIALMDAATCFIFGTQFVPVASSEPSELESKRLMKSSQSRNQRLPKTLYIPTDLVADILSVEAQRDGGAVVRVPEQQLALFIDEARKGFKEHVGDGHLH
ncbi:MAG TPA: hypothetical protein VFN13_12595 [Rudaea sp.]|nr:hypothetical protein [Rudaea sp.]